MAHWALSFVHAMPQTHGRKQIGLEKIESNVKYERMLFSPMKRNKTSTDHNVDLYFVSYRALIVFLFSLSNTRLMTYFISKWPWNIL